MDGSGSVVNDSITGNDTHGLTDVTGVMIEAEETGCSESELDKNLGMSNELVKLVDTEELWQELVEFSNASPPVLLWHNHGKYQVLFKFLAPRFLLAPDHVLDAERIHVRWQWICKVRRSQKLQNMNEN